MMDYTSLISTKELINTAEKHCSLTVNILLPTPALDTVSIYCGDHLSYVNNFGFVLRTASSGM
jgi:hypothetical protein